MPFFRQRETGFRVAMAEAGLEVHHACFAEGYIDPESSRRVARLAAAGEMTAVACANDQMALELWTEAEALGLRIPDDLSIVGIDNRPEAAERGLTSFRIAIEAMGRATVDAAVAALGGAEPWRRLETYEMVCRASVAAPRG